MEEDDDENVREKFEREYDDDAELALSPALWSGRSFDSWSERRVSDLRSVFLESPRDRDRDRCLLVDCGLLLSSPK